MVIDNKFISNIFEEIADILEIKGEIIFKIRAYRNAVRTLNSLTDNICNFSKEDLLAIKGIGKDLANKIIEICDTGKLEYLNDLKKSIPEELLDFLKIEGLGPKNTAKIYKEFNVSSIKELEDLVKTGKLKTLKGFGERLEQKIIAGIKSLRKNRGKYLISEVEKEYLKIKKYLIRKYKNNNITVAGSQRRAKELIKDIDILMTSSSNKETKKIMKCFCDYPEVQTIINQGETKSGIKLNSGINVDLRVVSKNEYPAALCYFTGSKEHNIILRQISNKLGLKLNEYGLFKKDSDTPLNIKSEPDIYKRLNLQFIPPELREGRCETELAAKNKIPDLITLKDIKCDLQMHTTASDGANSIEEMALAAQKLGYEYILITDHSKAVTVANGLDEKRLEKHIENIKQVNKKIDDFTILSGVELDILKDGTLDLDINILNECDLVLGSIHSYFKLNRDAMTKRIIKAFEKGIINIFAHPTGRILLRRESYDFDFEMIIKIANEYNIAFEINAHPARLDLNDIYCKKVLDNGGMISINTDAHSVNQLEYMKYGIGIARRGYCKKENCINTYSLKDILKKFKK